MKQLSLFGNQYNGFQGKMTATTEYGTVVELDRAGKGFEVREIEIGKSDYVVFFDTFEEAHIAFKHFIIDITSKIELKEDGSIGFYPEMVRVQEGPTLFDFVS